jgi:hypothetical protein
MTKRMQMSGFFQKTRKKTILVKKTWLNKKECLSLQHINLTFK